MSSREGLGVLSPDGVEDSGLARTVRALMTGTTHLVCLIEADGTAAWISRSVTNTVGYTADELVGQSLLPLLHPDDAGMAVSMLAGINASASDPQAGDADIGGEYRFRHKDGRWIALEVIRSDHLHDPKVRGILVIARPVAARKALDDALNAIADDDDGQEALTKLVEFMDVRIPSTKTAILVASGGEGHWVTSAVPTDLIGGDGPWQSTLRGAATGLAGHEVADLPEELADKARAFGMVACWCLPIPLPEPVVYTSLPSRGRGRVAGCLVVWSSEHAEPLRGHVGVMERVSGMADLAIRRGTANRALRRAAERDHLTGVLNRGSFERLALRGEPATYLVVDLDNFKSVNDRWGHPTGDGVLQTATQRIRSVLRAGDSLGRLGGDEFGVRVVGTDMAAAEAVARRIVGVLDAPVEVGGVSIDLGASVGLAPFDPAVSYLELFSRADAALLQAKRFGKGTWRVWSEA